MFFKLENDVYDVLCSKFYSFSVFDFSLNSSDFLFLFVPQHSIMVRADLTATVSIVAANSQRFV